MFLKDNAGNITLEDGGTIHEYTVPYSCGGGIEKVSSTWEESSNDIPIDLAGLGVGISINLDSDLGLDLDLDLNLGL